MKAAQKELDGMNALVKGFEKRATELAGEVTTMKGRQQAATDFLLQAQEKEAQRLMAEEEAKFNKFKATYTAGKAEFDTLKAKEDAGSATAADITRVDELQTWYEANLEIYAQYEKNRMEKEKENTQKSFEKELNSVEKMRTNQVNLEATLADITAKLAKFQADETKLNTDITNLNT